MKPPLPPRAPPLAYKLPATDVLERDQILIVPPLPFWMADVSITELEATVTSFAKLLFCIEFLM